MLSTFLLLFYLVCTTEVPLHCQFIPDPNLVFCLLYLLAVVSLRLPARRVILLIIWQIVQKEWTSML